MISVCCIVTNVFLQSVRPDYMDLVVMKLACVGMSKIAIKRMDLVTAQNLAGPETYVRMVCSY